MRILVVEDEKKVAAFVRKGLEEEGYAVDVAIDGEKALYMAEMSDYDLIILDWMIPKKDGLAVLGQLRASGLTTPVILLTARDAVQDKVQGLNTGADDYLAKPFDFAELLARVRALFRRGKSDASTVLEVGDLRMDLLSRKVTRAGVAIDLTAKEYSLLEYFMRNTGKVLTRTMIAEHVWDVHFDSDSNVIDVYVNYLRNKIDRPFEPKLLQTVRGVGYALKT
ncbi:MAG: DNA-binding response regulator [Deltaproteobacteria bacterium RBG_13_65_10]|nr:MAG: DNA-binding response regulator [Deltaproteobacteria bacterium RBG_13_65_10]